MTGSRAVLGIDAGTTSVKAVVLALDGQILGTSSSTVRIRHPRPEQAEQDMDEVWSAVAATITASCQEAGDVELIGVAVTGQGDGAWLIDAQGRPVGPALLWLDGRATHRVADWEGDGRGDLVRQVTGSALFPGALPVLLEEIEARDPAVLQKATTHLNCKDWIRFQLTGVRATDPSDASRTYLDVSRGQYSEALITGLGHERFRRLLPPLLAPAAIAGYVTTQAAKRTGLPVGLPVATGMVDTPAGGVGLGVTRPGQAYAILGTTAFVGKVRRGMAAPRALPVFTVALGESDYVVECLVPMNGTPNLDWARTVTRLDTLEWEEVEKLVEAQPAGAGGVLYLPYASVSGERAPFVDTNASASWLNLSVRTSAGEMLRAVYEGIALSMRECMDALGVASTEPVRLCGGGARSALVCQILADVTGRTVERSTFTELGIRGVAALALVATGHAEDLRAALGSFGDSTQRFDPNIEVRALHDSQAAVFTAVRDAIRSQWAPMRDLRMASYDGYRARARSDNTVVLARPSLPDHRAEPTRDGTPMTTIEAPSDSPQLLITAPFDASIAAALGDRFDVSVLESSMEGRPLAERGIDDQLETATAIICELDVINEATLDKAPALRVVISCRANPVNVDVAACTARGIAVLTTPARNAEVTADLAFNLLLMTVRHTGRAERWLRSCAWSSDDPFEPYMKFRGIQLCGRTLGILGGGAVGSRMLRRARAFGMEVLVYDPFLAGDAFGDEATVTSLDDVLSRSDIVTIHVPLAESTIGLLGDRELRLMHPDAYLINAGRAAVVEEDALVNALREGRLAGAGLDVFWTEPIPADHPLLGLDNVTMTPHIGGASDDVIAEHSRIAERGLRAWVDGTRPEAIRNPEVLAEATARGPLNAPAFSPRPSGDAKFTELAVRR